VRPRFSIIEEAVMSEIGRIVEQLQQAHEGGAWHGPSVSEALAGLGADGAARRPIGAAHSIREIVEHIRVIEEAVRRDVAGEAASGEAEWPTVDQTGETSWRAALGRLAATQRALRDAVSRLPEARLHAKVPGKEHSYWYELLGLAHHDLYHAGQISLLKKGL
jgi:uncharacterized damage-inducible protein DinB